MATVTPNLSKSGGVEKPKGKLEDHAAMAALYVTKNDTAAKKNREFLDSNNRLSSAGAATSLKYARPQDLPSYPSSGLKKNDSAAGAAASLGWANQKTFEHWKPDPSASASAAAVLAADYKLKPMWQPEQTMSGAKAAALAHKESGKIEAWKPEPNSWGSSAANQAFKKYPAGESTPVDYGYTTLGRQGSLMAATGAMSSSRKRAESTPIPRIETYPDERNASGNAMKAAMSVSKKSSRDNTGGAVPFTTLPREMFTNNPPVAPEVNELNRQNTLRASAVAMARGIYAQQQKSIDAASNSQAAAAANHRRKRSSASINSEDPQPMYLGNLQEAAHKLAQERLAKLHDDHAKNRDYRDYYGHSKPQSRLSIRGRARHRASSDGTLDEDREQSNKIRAQMSIFSSNVGQVDEKQRAKDREALIAVAQRNVTKSLHGMDEKVFADTGKVAPSLLSEWELKAHAAAQAKSETRLANHGKVDIGGGKFIDQSTVDAVAAKNVQPVLDEINEKATIERERQATIKAEQLEQQRKADTLKQREKETKAINKKLKQQDRDEEKLRKADEKAARDEEKRAEKEKRKSVNTKPAAVITSGNDEQITETAAEIEPPAHSTSGPPRPLPTMRTSMEDQASLRMKENADAANASESTSPKDGNKVKSWLKSRLSKRHSKNPRSPTEPVEKEAEPEKRKSFLGGAALASTSTSNSSISLGATSSSIRDVAMAGKGKETEVVRSSEEAPAASKRNSKRDSQVSKLSSKRDTDDDEFQEARDNFDEDLMHPSATSTEKGETVARDSKFKEAI